MVRQISSEQYKLVLELWFKGYSYREISKITNVSLGAISSIINMERKREPQIDDFRLLNKSLEDVGVSIIDAVRGALFLEKLNTLNVSQEKIFVSEIYGKSGKQQPLQLSKRLLAIKITFSFNLLFIIYFKGEKEVYKGIYLNQAEVLIVTYR